MTPSLHTPAADNRLHAVFAQCATQQRAALIPFIMAGAPNAADFAQLLQQLPAMGADIIEVGMPFSDPSADGPNIRLAAQQALAHGQTLVHTLQQVAAFRQHNQHTPIVLMGYYNPIFIYGLQKFATDATAAGVDAVIIVDLPPEEEGEYTAICPIPNIRLATPTTDAARLPIVLHQARGFIYVVSVSGVTGAKTIDTTAAQNAVNALRAQTNLPVVVGFGIRDVASAQQVAQFADGVVVGSALCAILADQGVSAALEFVKTLRTGMEKTA